MVLLLESTPALSKPATTPSIQPTLIGWEISKTVVVSEGSTVSTKEGILTTEYTIQGTARNTTADTPIRKGVFSLTLSVFSPAQDMPGQKAGNWYLQGDWSIVDRQATRESRKARHSPAAVKGKLSATLPFNPVITQGAIETTVNLPMSPGGGRWSSGKGTFA